MTIKQARAEGYKIIGEYGLPGTEIAALAYLPQDESVAQRQWAQLDDDGCAIIRDATDAQNQPWVLVPVTDED